MIYTFGSTRINLCTYLFLVSTISALTIQTNHLHRYLHLLGELSNQINPTEPRQPQTTFTVTPALDALDTVITKIQTLQSWLKSNNFTCNSQLNKLYDEFLETSLNSLWTYHRIMKQKSDASDANYANLRQIYLEKDINRIATAIFDFEQAKNIVAANYMITHNPKESRQIITQFTILKIGIISFCFLIGITFTIEAFRPQSVTRSTNWNYIRY